MPREWSTSGFDLHLDLDLKSGSRAGLERALREAIRVGRLVPGAALPSTRQLAENLDLSRGTVVTAYDQLVAEGYLTSRPGSGTRVAEIPLVPAGSVLRSAGEVAPRYDLRPGRPDPTTFPVAAWLRASRRVLTTAPPEVYALSDPRGRIELRLALAQHLGRTRGVLADPERILITNGYSQGVTLLAQVLARSGRTTLAMEDPGHPFHRAIASRAGLRISALPVDELGARTELLDGSIAAVALTPAHQYPTGATLHPRRRQAAIGWARATGGLIIEDDYDGGVPLRPATGRRPAGDGRESGGVCGDDVQNPGTGVAPRLAGAARAPGRAHG